MSGLVLNVTESCNLNCSYCIYSGKYPNEHRNNSSNMDFKVARRGIDLFIPQAEDPALISFYGGEPLNNMVLIKRIIEYTKKVYPDKRTIFSMTSNFYDADKHLKTIVDQDIHIVVSLDGPKEIHDRNRRFKNGKPTWNKIINNLKKLEEYSPGYVKSHVGQSVTCADPKDMLGIVDFFKNEQDYLIFRIGGIETKGLKNAKNVSKSFPMHELASGFLEYVNQKKQIPNVFRLLFDEKLKIITQRNKDKMPETLTLSGSCYPGKRKLFVDTDGQLYMCEKFGKRLPLGDVDRGMDQDSINKAIDEFTKIRNDYCTRECWAQRLCMPCIHSAKDSEGDISLEGLSQRCESSKLEILTSLALYTNIMKENEEFFERYSSKLNEQEVKK